MKRALLFSIALALFACGRTDGGSAPDQAPSAQAVDTSVMAYLSMARARHHEANVQESQGDVAGAIAALSQLAQAPLPHPGTTIPEVDEVLADTYARMAELELTRDGLDAAAHDVTEGLAHAKNPTFFRGHLLEVQGIIEEARGNRLADAGHADEAAQARKHAVELLREAIGIQESVVQQKTEGDR